MHLYLRSSRSSSLPTPHDTRQTGLDTTHSAEILSPLLPPGRPRSRPPARCLPHSRRRLLPIDSEIHSPVASSSPSTSRISAPSKTPSRPRTDPSSLREPISGLRPVCRSGFWSIGLSPTCPFLCCPIRSIVWPSLRPRLRPSAHPGRQQAPGLGTVPEPAAGLRAARNDEIRSPPYPLAHKHRIAPHLIAFAPGRPQWLARHYHTSCAPTLPCLSSTPYPNPNGTSHTPAQRTLYPPRHLETTHTQHLPASRPQHLALPTRLLSLPLPHLPVLLRRQEGALLPVPPPTRRPAAMPLTPAFINVPTV
jgi:hypothetical protein